MSGIRRADSGFMYKEYSLMKVTMLKTKTATMFQDTLEEDIEMEDYDEQQERAASSSSTLHDKESIQLEQSSEASMYSCNNQGIQISRNI